MGDALTSANITKLIASRSKMRRAACISARRATFVPLETLDERVCISARRATRVLRDVLAARACALSLEFSAILPMPLIHIIQK